MTIETLKGILLELEPNLDADTLKDIIDEVDEDGSGTIDFDGKIQFFQKITWNQLKFYFFRIYEHDDGLDHA